MSRSTGSGGYWLSVHHEKTASSTRVLQIKRGQAFLLYRDLSPAVVRTPRWFEDPRRRRYATLLALRRARSPLAGALGNKLPARKLDSVR